jgi:membrane protease subunit HflK
MAWNEPGGNNRDPWGGNNGRDQGPPDLDEIVRKLSGKFGGLLGNKRGGGDDNNSGNGSGGDSGSGGSSAPSFGTGGIVIIGVIALLLWLGSGIYIVDEGTRAVELRFGQVSNITEPGLSYHLPYPIEERYIVDVEQLRAQEIGYRSGGGGRQATRTVPQEALMLTEDENVVDVRLSVQYQVNDPEAYLFAISDPDETLAGVIESSIREVVGRNTMDFVLTEGRADVVAEVQILSQDILNQYRTGLSITNVNLQDAQPPEQVQAAFADAIKAREDEQRLINEAEAYSNEVLPVARGDAARVLEESAAYKEQVIARAEGESSRFEQLLTEYAKAPLVTRERLYIEAIESMLSRTNKVLIDTDQSNNLLYLPLDRMMNRDTERSSPGRDASGAAFTPPPTSFNPNASDSTSRLRDTSRQRDTR